jgi:hypothetical protein
MNIKLGSFKSFTRFSPRNTGLLFLLILLCLLAGEAFVIKRSVNVIMASKRDPISLKPSQGVRINFAAYDSVVSHLETAKIYQPSSTPITNPFYVSQDAPPAQ